MEKLADSFDPCGSKISPPAAHFVSEDGASGELDRRDALASMSDNLPAGYLCDTGKSSPHDGEGSQRIEKRDCKFTLRVSSRERAAFEARARLLGVTTGAWLRAVALDALDARHDNLASIVRAHAVTSVHPDLARAVEQVRRVGVNLNQAVRKNLTVDDDLLNAVLDTLHDVREKLGDRTAL